MSASEGDESARSIAEAVARRSYGKLVAFLCARTRDVAAAEDALSEAFAAALAAWPQSGCPDNPEAWLLTVARRKLIDAGRRARNASAASPDLQLLANELESAEAEGEIPDRRLALMFACAHPAIDTAVRAPLMLQVLLGLDAQLIASAFLTSPAAMGQRLVRAKNKIRQAGIAFTVPTQEELPARLETVLDAIYAAFAQGWMDPGGTDVARRDLAEEALFLGRLLVELLPEEPEALGLLALMLHAHARRHARRSVLGAYVPFSEHDTSLWDNAMIDAAESLLRRASVLRRIGRFQLEGALQSAHVHRRRTGENNWPAVLQLYDSLLVLSGSPVVAINRVLALAEVAGARQALTALEAIAADPRVAGYQPYWAARADLLARAGETQAAREAYDRATGLESDAAVRAFLQDRQALLPRRQ
jgi:predicted RNA polymerase sigma factor